MKKTKSMAKNFIFHFILPGITLLVLLICVIVFVSIYYSTSDTYFLYALGAISLGLFSLFVVLFVLALRKFYSFYYKGVFKVTKNNLQALCNNDIKFERYPSFFNLKEVESLNDELNKVELEFKYATITKYNIDYVNSGLEFVPGFFDDVITYSSFKKQLSNIIGSSSSFRNVVFEVYFNIEEGLKNNEVDKIIETIRNYFKSYKNILFSVHENKRSIFVYLPIINTFSRIKEQLVYLIQNTSITRETAFGVETCNAKVVLVSYPYSDVHEIFHDLEYAKQKVDVINMYFPNRIMSKNDYSMRKESININIVSKVLESLGELYVVNEVSKKQFQEKIRHLFASIFAFLDLDEAGLITLETNSMNFYSNVNISNSGLSTFKEGKEIDKEFISYLMKEKDIDNSYYFSSRSMANNSIGRYFDKYTINSGFYYVLIDANGKEIGIIYFFKYKTDLVLSSYLREGLYLFSSRLGEFLYHFKRNTDANDTYEIIGSILKLSNAGAYKVDKHTYDIVNFSSNLTSLFKDIKRGEKCYKVFYGSNKPCSNCPLLTGKRTIKDICGHQYEVSMNISRDNTYRYINLYLKQLNKNDVVEDRFNKDFLVNSFSDLVENIKNCYAINGKGHLLLMKIDNIDDLVTKHGSEYVTLGIRTFLNNIKKAFNNVLDVYYFNSQTFGVLCPDCGVIDIVNRVEKIYEISRNKYFDDKYSEDVIKVTYFPMVYPSGYPSGEDFLKNAQKFLFSNPYESGLDMIHFAETGYTRPASRKEFMLTVIDDKFGNSTFISNLQPYLKASDRSIVGVEMLLRLQDDYRNIVFNANEIIKVAAENNKMRIISDALINYVGNLYRNQGSAIFKTFGLKRFSINIDYSYFHDSSSIDHLIDIIKSYGFPKNFITFEIPEKDILGKTDKYKYIIQAMDKADVIFTCDQYTQEDISLEQLKDIGFKEVKICRSISGFIDKDPPKEMAITNIITTAKQLGLNVSVVGIENNNQYEIVRSINSDVLVQGYYFFKPLDKNDLIKALRNTHSRG